MKPVFKKIDQKKIKFLIIGAGPCGLGAAHRLKELGIDDFLILEQKSYPGGLSETIVDEKGFRWDIGGHVIHSHYSYFDKIIQQNLSSKELTKLNRNAYIFLYKKFIPYPFQKNLKYLPQKIKRECIDGLEQTPNKFNNQKNFNYHEWIINNFGQGIAKYFLLKENFKHWAYPLKKMGIQWLKERVADNSQEKNKQWGPNKIFYYPKQGTHHLWQKIANSISKQNFAFKQKLTKVDLSKKIAYSQNTKYHYQHLISTIPITNLIKISNFEKEVANNYKKLFASSIYVVGIGLKGNPPRQLKDKSWIYFAEDDFPFFRVTILSNYSSKMVPGDNNWSLMCEVSSSRYKKVDKEKIVDQVINSLTQAGFIKNKQQIISKFLHYEKFAYPTPILNRDKIIDPIIKKLAKKQIYSRGRFGTWKYEVGNMDHSFMQGLEVINAIVKEQKELTIWQPELINNNL